MTELINGFLNLSKPAGLTSHDCVARVRRLLHIKRVGHGGTLDPAATGVLPIALGRATRLLQFLQPNKAYRATVRFGLRTTTDDLDGDILNQQPVPHLSLEAIAPHLPQFQGIIQQVPPSYSAVQVKGKRLYQLARSGEEVEVPVRTVEVHHIDVLDWRAGDYPELDVAIACGSGTYIRSIARDLGDVLGTGATLAMLIRTESSGFFLDTSLTLDQLGQQVEGGDFTPIAPAAALQHLPEVVLSPPQVKYWCNGRSLFLKPGSVNCSFDTVVRVQDSQGEFLGVADYVEERGKSKLVPKMVFTPA
ncbi:MAG: tRNA pseudouridine(55) synthase TruB [Synechococcales bacterium]|nr:tRNA pseudouridine(55) synthase TruB [Synechococcales bacterium]